MLHFKISKGFPCVYVYIIFFPIPFAYLGLFIFLEKNFQLLLTKSSLRSTTLRITVPEGITGIYFDKTRKFQKTIHLIPICLLKKSLQYKQFIKKFFCPFF